MPYYPPQREREPENHPPRKKTVLRGMIFCASALLIVYGAVRLTGYFTDLASSRQTVRELREAAAQPEASAEPELRDAPVTEIPATEAPAPLLPPDNAEPADTLPRVPYPNGYELVPRIQKLRKKSDNVIGWLTMDDLDEPVAMKDNSFFLDHDAMGKRNVNGSIFMDEDTNLLTRPYTILLYGHNMKTGAMFGNLRKYGEHSYCFTHRFLQFDTLYEEGKYEIFAVSTISLTPGKAKYVNLTALQSADRRNRREALDALIRASDFVSTAKVTEEDQLLLLITCDGEDDERLVVTAKRL